MLLTEIGNLSDKTGLVSYLRPVGVRCDGRSPGGCVSGGAPNPRTLPVFKAWGVLWISATWSLPVAWSWRSRRTMAIGVFMVDCKVWRGIPFRPTPIATKDAVPHYLGRLGKCCAAWHGYGHISVRARWIFTPVRAICWNAKLKIVWMPATRFCCRCLPSSS